MSKTMAKCISITKLSTIFKVTAQYILDNKNNCIRKNKIKIVAERRCSALKIIIKNLLQVVYKQIIVQIGKCVSKLE